MADFLFKTEPWEHQREALELSWDREAFALLMEQRTGKSKVTIDTLTQLERQGDVNALFILAPNGVHLNWIEQELPTHLPVPYTYHTWQSSSRASRWSQEERADLLKTRKLAVLSMNVEALVSDAAYEYAYKFLRQRDALMAIDESDLIATPGAKRTKRARALGKAAPVRRILTGTLSTESPFQVYSQFAFLDPDILGFKTYTAFKTRYGVWSEGYSANQGRSFPVLESYQHVEEINQKIAPHSYRKRREECADLPPKVYQTKYFELTPAQRNLYNQLRDEYIIELQDGILSATHVLTRMLRLQQISNNYWPSQLEVKLHEACSGEGCERCSWLGLIETEAPLRVIDLERNPRLELLREVLEEEPDEPTIVWCNFRHDVDQVMNLLPGAARLDGAVPPPERRSNMNSFQAGETNHVVGTPAAAGRGYRLDRASRVIYYSNGYSLSKRLQSEDRAEDLGKVGNERGTGIIDLVAQDTIDGKILEAHLTKRQLSALIVGDPLGDWF